MVRRSSWIGMQLIPISQINHWQPYLVLYTEEDLEKEGIQYAGYAIVIGFKVPESGPIPRN